MSLRFAENDIRAKGLHPGACFQIEKVEARIWGRPHHQTPATVHMARHEASV
jgi:hypothetical protein